MFERCWNNSQSGSCQVTRVLLVHNVYCIFQLMHRNSSSLKQMWQQINCFVLTILWPLIQNGIKDAAVRKENWREAVIATSCFKYVKAVQHHVFISVTRTLTPFIGQISVGKRLQRLKIHRGLWHEWKEVLFQKWGKGEAISGLSPEICWRKCKWCPRTRWACQDLTVSPNLMNDYNKASLLSSGTKRE